MPRKPKPSSAPHITITPNKLMDNSVMVPDESYDEFLQRIGLTIPPIPAHLFGLSNDREYLSKTFDRLVDSEYHYQQRFILIHGPSGSGKTALVLSMARKYADKLTFFYVPCRLCLEKRFGNQETRLQQIFSEASHKQPSLVLFDEIDFICSDKKSSSDIEKRAYNALVSELSSIRSQLHSKILVVATTHKFDSLDPAVRGPGRGLSKHIMLDLPDESDRKEFLDAQFEGILSLEDLSFVASACKYFSYYDLEEFCSEVRSLSTTRPSIETFRQVLSSYKPSAVTSITTPVPNIRWSDIGGCEGIKKELVKAVISPATKRGLYKELGKRPPRGILLYGPPGCSKTMMGAALANESGHNFICIRGPELFSKYVGDTEAEIRRIYKHAQQIAPSIIFFDEFDAMGSDRNNNGSSSDVSHRAVQQLLTIMDSLPPIEGVFTLAATNRPDTIDRALLRPGRFSFKLHVPLPNLHARCEILRIHTKKFKHLFEDDYETVIQQLAVMTRGYSGAEIMGVCDEATTELCESESSLLSVENHFKPALSKIRPETSLEDLKMFDKINRQYKSGTTSLQPLTRQKTFKRLFASFRRPTTDK